jgi:hypothetical protein
MLANNSASASTASSWPENTGKTIYGFAPFRRVEDANLSIITIFLTCLVLRKSSPRLRGGFPDAFTSRLGEYKPLCDLCNLVVARQETRNYCPDAINISDIINQLYMMCTCSKGPGARLYISDELEGWDVAW